MKKFFLLAALVGVAFTSCVKNEEHVTPDQPKPVTFEPAKYKPVSGRAEVAFPQQESFGTFAFYRTTAVASEDHSVFMPTAFMHTRTSWSSSTTARTLTTPPGLDTLLQNLNPG